jgi:hypothetical protein
MHLSVIGQFYQALSAMALGIMCAVIYDFLRTLRRRFPGVFVTAVCDFLFSLVFCCGLFLLGFSLGSGEQRLFMMIFAFLAASLYFCLCSRFMLGIFGILLTFIGKILSVAAFPLVLVSKLFEKINFFLKNLFHYIKKWYTIENIYGYFSAKSKHSRISCSDKKGQ